MFTISESLYAELHKMNFDQIQTLHDSFVASFPHKVQLYIPAIDVLQAITDLEEIAGPGHPESSTTYSSDVFQWSEYHPTGSAIVRDGSMLMVSTIGFAKASDAIQFKLKWFKS